MKITKIKRSFKVKNIKLSHVANVKLKNNNFITFLDGKTLNMSPLRGTKGVYFVKNSEDLLDAINAIGESALVQKRNYFHLDPSLPRWHKWLFNNFDKEQKKEFIS